MAAAIDPHEQAGEAWLRHKEGGRHLIAKADAEQLHRAIAGLPLAYREALVLREIEGLSYQEISSVMSIPIGTVMSRLARARNLLIQRIGMTGKGKAGAA